MPCTKYRWKAKNTASGTSIEMNDPGPITLMFDENAPICSRSAYVIGALSEVANTSATSRSFPTQRNWTMASDAIAGPWTAPNSTATPWSRPSCDGGTGWSPERPGPGCGTVRE